MSGTGTFISFSIQHMIIDYLYTGVMSLVLADVVDCISGIPYMRTCYGRRLRTWTVSVVSHTCESAMDVLS